MSKLDTAARKALSADDFGDPARRLFPIVDQEDVDSAAHLIGKAKNTAAVKARIIAIAKRKGLSIPDAWKVTMSTTESVPARFDLKAGTRTVVGEYAVYPDALLWVAGDYADKNYAMTPEENLVAVESFTPVFGNIEHTDFLSGRACEVRSIRLDDDPARIRAEVAVPLALDTLMETRERGLSCEWNRSSKLLEGLALTTNPRVPEAALMSNRAVAAFAKRHDTPQGQTIMQQLHDMSAQGGAVCSAGNARMASAHESKALQAIHDITTEHGATCSSGGKPAWYSKLAGSGQGRSIVSFWSKLTRAERDEARQSGAALPEETEISAIDRLVEEKVAAERASFNQKLAEANAQRLQAEAAHKADALVREGKLMPPEREPFIAFRVNAAMEDATSTATFATGKSRVASFDAIYDARPSHGLFNQRVAAGDAHALANSTGENPAVKEAIEAAKAWAAKQEAARGK